MKHRVLRRRGVVSCVRVAGVLLLSAVSPARFGDGLGSGVEGGWCVGEKRYVVELYATTPGDSTMRFMVKAWGASCEMGRFVVFWGEPPNENQRGPTLIAYSADLVRRFWEHGYQPAPIMDSFSCGKGD